jgi:hypothetical protein
MHEYPPPRRRGLLLHGALILVLLAVLMVALWQLFQVTVGPSFTVYVILALGTFIGLPFLGYRAYALWKANYTLDRDNFRIEWGLRGEEVPISDVEWVRSPQDLTTPLHLPMVRMPGAVLGTRRHPDLGDVEFLASDSGKLLLVATAKQVYAISPADSAGFVNTFQHTIEQGSLIPGTSHSQYPSFVLSLAWDNMLARYLWLAGLFLNIGLLAWVTATIPTMDFVAFGFSPTGEALMVPGVQFIIIPILSILLYVTGFIAGLYFFRWEEYKTLAFILWGAGAFTSLLFLISVMILLNTHVSP